MNKCKMCKKTELEEKWEICTKCCEKNMPKPSMRLSILETKREKFFEEHYNDLKKEFKDIFDKDPDNEPLLFDDYCEEQFYKRGQDYEY